MRPFRYVRASDPNTAAGAVIANPRAKVLAGGPKLLDLVKEDVERADEVVGLHVLRAGLHRVVQRLQLLLQPRHLRLAHGQLAHPLLLARVGRHRLVGGAARGEDEGARARARLQGRPARLDVLLEPGQRRPGEAPVLAVAVEAGGLGVKGVGETGTIASTPAVMNAVVDALDGLGVHDVPMPASPLNVWSAIQSASNASSNKENQ